MGKETDFVMQISDTEFLLCSIYPHLEKDINKRKLGF